MQDLEGRTERKTRKKDLERPRRKDLDEIPGSKTWNETWERQAARPPSAASRPRPELFRRRRRPRTKTEGFNDKIFSFRRDFISDTDAVFCFYAVK